MKRRRRKAAAFFLFGGFAQALPYTASEQRPFYQPLLQPMNEPNKTPEEVKSTEEELSESEFFSRFSGGGGRSTKWSEIAEEVENMEVGDAKVYSGLKESTVSSIRNQVYKKNGNVEDRTDLDNKNRFRSYVVKMQQMGETAVDVGENGEEKEYDLYEMGILRQQPQPLPTNGEAS